MKAELLRHFKSPIYWGILSAGLLARAALGGMDRMYRTEDFWALSQEFWSKTGSVTVAFLILLVLIRLFSIDREKNTRAVIGSTAQGRTRLFFRRLGAGCLAAATGVCLLTVGDLEITTLLGRGLPCPAGWVSAYLHAAGVALPGALGYFLLAACVCDITQNQPAAMCICGLPFGLSYFINASAVKPFGFFWFFRYGFFTELMRGRLPDSRPGFWAVWYGALLGGSLFCAIHKRKERKDL